MQGPKCASIKAPADSCFQCRHRRFVYAKPFWLVSTYFLRHMLHSHMVTHPPVVFLIICLLHIFFCHFLIMHGSYVHFHFLFFKMSFSDLRQTGHFKAAAGRSAPHFPYQPGQKVWLSSWDLSSHVDSCILAPRFIGPYKIVKLLILMLFGSSSLQP